MFFPLLTLSIFLKVHGGTFTVDYINHQFVKDGQPFKYISGSIHYFRIHPNYWDDRLKRVRAMGLNAIQIYAPWNLHEPKEGNFDFSGIANLTQFLTLAQQNDLNVLFRPGPYICAEWEYGGFPYWLINYQGIQLRTSNAIYTSKVQNYYDKLLDVIKPFLYKNGGPILMVQVENEYGYMQACDFTYMNWLRDYVRSKLGDDVVLYTTDGGYDWLLKCGAVNNTVTTVDFQPDTHANIDSHFHYQDMFSKGAPHVCSEFYTDWYLQWGQNYDSSKSTSLIIDNIDYIYNAKNGSVNLYLVHGGTNFEFYNGAKSDGTSLSSITTSYWIGSPIAENGNITDMYLAIRGYLGNLTGWDHPPTPIPSNNPSFNYGQVTLTKIDLNLISTLTRIQEPCVNSQSPMTFEQLDHGYGFVLYTTVLKTSGMILNASSIRDYGYVFLNNGMLYRDTNTTLTLNNGQAGDILRILVENRGRWDFFHDVWSPPLDWKGLGADVALNNVTIDTWSQCGINLTRASVDSLSQTFLEVYRNHETRAEKAISQPGVYVGQFNADVLEDTYLDTTGWGKGQLFINGYNLGRYWPNEGPQMTLYVAKPFLQQKNTVLLIELTGTQQNYVDLIDHPIFKF